MNRQDAKEFFILGVSALVCGGFVGLVQALEANQQDQPRKFSTKDHENAVAVTESLKNKSFEEVMKSMKLPEKRQPVADARQFRKPAI